MDEPGWSDERHCRVGLIELDEQYRERKRDRELLLALQEEMALFEPLLGRRQEMALAAD
jgi:hypothetical protein